jgi:GTPase KRas
VKPGDGFLLVYSVTSRDSFEEISKFHGGILKLKRKCPPPFILVGNKCDIEHARDVGVDSENDFFVFDSSLNHLEGHDLATHFGCGFFETSASHRINVDESFNTLVRMARKRSEVGCIHS